MIDTNLSRLHAPGQHSNLIERGSRRGEFGSFRLQGSFELGLPLTQNTLASHPDFLSRK